MENKSSDTENMLEENHERHQSITEKVFSVVYCVWQKKQPPLFRLS